MHCINCYRELKPGIRFCPYCGAQQINRQAYRGNTGDDWFAEETTQQENPYAGETAQEENPYAGKSAQEANASARGRNGGASRTGSRRRKAKQAKAQKGQTVYAGRTKAPHAAWYMVLSVISALCWAGLPFGVVSIAFSSKISTAVKAEDTELAWEYARLSRIWMIAAFAAGILSWGIYILWKF